MKQVNIVGSSPFSESSRLMQTLQSSPDVAPTELVVFSASETSLRVRWEVRKTHTHFLIILVIKLGVTAVNYWDCIEMFNFLLYNS